MTEAVTNRASEVTITTAGRTRNCPRGHPRLLALGGVAGADAQLGDLVPVAGSDFSLGANPGTANSVDEGSVDELLDVGVVDTAGGQELHVAEGTGQILQSVQTVTETRFDALITLHCSTAHYKAQ